MKLSGDDSPWYLLTDGDLQRSFGDLTVRRGIRYAEEGRVRRVDVDHAAQVATATVSGSGGQVYETEVWVELEPRTGRRLPAGDCSCPVDTDCKHAVALLHHLRLASQRLASDSVAGNPAGPVVPRIPDWQRRLAAVLDGGAVAGPLRKLALQVDEAPRRSAGATYDDGRSRLRLRPLAEGRTGNWIKTGASWRDVVTPYSLPDVVPAQREALAQLYAAHLASRPHHYYASHDEHLRVADMGASLWPMLVGVADAGVAVVDGKGRPITIADLRIVVALDVTAGEGGGMELAVTMTYDGDLLPVDAVSLIGLPAHGAELRVGEQIVLAALDHPLPVHLGSLWQQAEPLGIPAEDAERFLLDFSPGLRQLLPISSGDGSVALPEVTGPRLGVDVLYDGSDRVGLDWTLDYRIGEALRALPLGAPPPLSWRDLAAEAALLRDPPLPAEVRLAPQQVLHRLDAARFVNEWLPLLHGDPRVDVREHGSRPDLRLIEEAPLVTLATSDVPGERDWFDLEVEVTVAGEQIVLADLLVALTNGESHLFLDSGAYFPLDRPELAQLRALLEEAAALQDHPGRSTRRISRFQAGLWEELVALGVVGRQSAAWERSVRGLIALEEIPEPDLPAALEAELRPYQREGYRWLSFLWDHDLGGILADDMGLGKTVQTLALLARAAERGDLTAPALVIAPASVVHNWAAEARRFAPKLAVATVTETRSRRGEDLTDVVGGADLVVTSYTIFRLEHEGFAALPWRALVLDESQAVKNPSS